LLTDLQRAAADPQGKFLPSIVAGGHIRLEEVKLEIPVRRNPQESLAHCGEYGRLHHRVRVEVVQLHLIIMKNRRIRRFAGVPNPRSRNDRKQTT